MVIKKQGVLLVTQRPTAIILVQTNPSHLLPKFAINQLATFCHKSKDKVKAQGNSIDMVVVFKNVSELQHVNLINYLIILTDYNILSVKKFIWVVFFTDIISRVQRFLVGTKLKH